MRILIVHNEYKHPGGEDAAVANDIALLTAHGHEVALYTRHNEDLSEFYGPQAVYLPRVTEFNNETYADISKLLTEEHFDLVHVHNTLHLITPAVYYAAVEAQVPIVQTLHNYRFLCPAGTCYRKGKGVCEDCMQKGMSEALFHRCYRGSLAETSILVKNMRTHLKSGIYENLSYICLTDFMKEKFISVFPDFSGNVYVKANVSLADAKSETPDPKGDIASLLSEKERFYLYAGRLGEEKGIRVLLAAWLSYVKVCEAQGKEAAKLYICGDGILRSYLEKKIAVAGITEIRLMGQVSEETVQTYMKRARALVVPSLWYEGYPMVIAESEKVGTPAIVSALGSMKELTKDGVNGFTFPAGNEKALVDRLLRMDKLYDEGDAEAMVGHVLFSAGEHTGEKNYERLIDIYEDVLQKYR
ncbi:MAG: glycosyltransferase [Lachnospiraceae bacterium]|nr:glycosyltransferase [Lachnospiraceae bacterium]